MRGSFFAFVANYYFNPHFENFLKKLCFFAYFALKCRRKKN